MGPRSFVSTRRSDVAVAVLRGIVAGLVAIHVALVASDLAAAGLLAWAVAATCAVGASAVVGLLASFLRLDPHGRVAATCLTAVLDAFGLIAIARMTVDIDPTASIAWAFVLWVPFSIAVRTSAAPALAATAGAALLVWAASASSGGALSEIESTWTATGVPMLLVLVAGLITLFATFGQRRTGQNVHRQLVDERMRTTRLREADDLKNTFLAAVSHELRTPLTSILGFSLTMLDRPDLDAAQRERMLRTVVVEAEHLEDILANLLDLDRLTRGKATLVPISLDPAALVRSSVEHVRRRSGRVVALDLEEGMSIQLDASKVERIVENLVANAVKYTPHDADITVALWSEGRGITIRVDDGGPGISRELRESIFEPFRRGLDVGVPGTGIGLSLVDRFSRMHGGRAWVEERPGGGCRFQVHLPAAGSSRQSGRPVEQVEPATVEHAAQRLASASGPSSVD